MKKFNKSKVIIPALAMIALTTAASATGTVAWFAANGTVTASTMTFKAVAGANLYIKKGVVADVNTITETSVTDLGVNVSTAGISPCDMKASGGTVTVQKPATWTSKPTVNDKGNPATYTPIADVTSSSPTEESDDALELKKYIALAHVTIARKQTNASSFTLRPSVDITFGDVNNLNKAIRAGLIINGVYYESGDLELSEDNKKGSYTWNASEQLTLPVLDDNKAYSTALMIWYEGNDDDCISNNAIDVTTNVATWTFTDTSTITQG